MYTQNIDRPVYWHFPKFSTNEHNFFIYWKYLDAYKDFTEDTLIFQIRNCTWKYNTSLNVFSSTEEIDVRLLEQFTELTNSYLQFKFKEVINSFGYNMPRSYSNFKRRLKYSFLIFHFYCSVEIGFTAVSNLLIISCKSLNMATHCCWYF